MVWMLKFAIAVVAAIGILKLAGGHESSPLATTTDALNYATAARYVNNSSHKAVIVGSSLSVRMSDDYLASANIENLALSGESAVTGLKIAAEATPAPKVVLIEANILVRRVNKDLIDKLADQTSVFRPVRAVAQYYETLMHAPKSKEDARVRVDRLIASPPSSSSGTELAPQILAEAQAVPQQEAVHRTIADIRKFKAILESNGAIVLLFHMPCSPEYENTPLATRSTELASDAFPSTSDWLNIAVDQSQLRWTDGIHLDPRSAALVARFIGHEVDKFMASKTGS
ncbi:hypothetical protein [Bradyrhizobium sp. 6(2017)]|uniref:hypothetical protein n=1 Tax=Bradyrhizobium sp. 6(2017) TaxID=1197460 RepID=UPI0013E171C1|nr:hypothetical protein [Bradyrhizobium sp. 6(2017)]QIG92804.1 hypothetical protein G6P99_09990 [Bradyrhizobium sp. 6(2017)]